MKMKKVHPDREDLFLFCIVQNFYTIPAPIRFSILASQWMMGMYLFLHTRNPILAGAEGLEPSISWLTARRIASYATPHFSWYNLK